MNTLTDKQVTQTLALLHEKAEADHELRMKAKQKAAQQGIPFEHAWATAYLAVNAEEGRFLNFLATVTKAKNIVEFGCSFGISTIYLAAAAKDNGGHVTTTDIEPTKIAGARENIGNAGLGSLVTLLEGDATQTLAGIAGPIDFLFLDGAKELYLPVFQLLQSKLASGAIIFADNANQEGTQSFIKYILKEGDQYSSVQLFNDRAFIAYMK